MDRMKKRQRSNTQLSRPSHKKSRQASPPFSSAFKTTFSSASPTPFTWTPQPVPRSSVASSILLQEMMTEMREQRAILTTLATQQQELIKDVKKIMSTMGLDDSKPEMMDAEYNYYA
tara:strand:+ start:1207 stop:1557 length:351 start_codon:yes stop_codon:yes gene_type:complete